MNQKKENVILSQFCMGTKLLSDVGVCAASFWRKIWTKGGWYFLLVALYYCKICFYNWKISATPINNSIHSADRPCPFPTAYLFLGIPYNNFQILPPSSSSKQTSYEQDKSPYFFKRFKIALLWERMLPTWSGQVIPIYVLYQLSTHASSHHFLNRSLKAVKICTC